MPRIGSGGSGGPIVPPQTPGTKSTQESPQTSKTDFASKIQGGHQGTDSARTQQAKQAQQSKLTGKATEIARRLDSGALTQREAVQEFVSLVIEERFPKFKKKKKGKKNEDDSDKSGEDQLEDAVTELIESDPALAQRLQSQFKKLAAKG